MSFYDDISRHFHNKLMQLIDDTASTCQITDMDPRDLMSLVVSNLFYELIRIAAINQVNEEDFLHTCQIAYKSIMPEISKALRKRKRSQKPIG